MLAPTMSNTMRRPQVVLHGTGVVCIKFLWDLTTDGIGLYYIEFILMFNTRTVFNSL